jgi:hypothetical protein
MSEKLATESCSSVVWFNLLYFGPLVLDRNLVLEEGMFSAVLVRLSFCVYLIPLSRRSAGLALSFLSVR